jgi:hypothetical protein
MKTLPLLAALAATTALAACVPRDKQGKGNEAAESNEAATTAEGSLTNNATAAAPAPTNVPPKPGALKTFKDWAVGCDNVLTCTMASLGPEAGDFPVITIAIERDAGPAGAWRVSMQVNETGDKPPAPIAAIAVDNGQTVAVHKDTVGGSAAAALIAAVANGNAITLRDAGGGTIETISLAGASAGLRYIEAMQGRADTVTAVVAKGSKPASAVPATPAMPMIAALTPTDTPASLTAAQIASLRSAAQCDDSAGDTTPEYHPLGGGKTLLMFACSAGAYNVTSNLYVIENGIATPAKMDAPSGFGTDDQTGASVVNGDFEHGVLSSYVKGRGLGDCGSSQEFVWDGDRFRLSKQEDMGECRGNPNYITTWRASVTRR